MMANLSNEAVVRLYLQETWANGNLAAVAELAAPDISVFYPVMDQPAVGHDAVKKLISGHHAIFTVRSLAVDELIVASSQVVVRWTQRVNHIGALLNIVPSGKELSFTGITIFRVARGLVADERGEENFWGIARQIGAA